MKKTTGRLLIVIILFFSFGTAWAKEPFTVVSSPWPPYVFIENNEVKGSDADITKAVLKKTGIKANIEMMPWKRCLSMVKARKADAILAVSITGERKKFLHFSEEPVSEGTTVFFIKKGRTIPFSKLEDLYGLQAGVLLGYKYCDAIDQAPFTKRASRVRFLEQNFNMLLHDRIDFVIEVDAVGFHKAKKMGISEKITLIPDARYCHGGNYLAFAQKPGYEQIAIEFSNALKEFKTTDEYELILNKYSQRVD